VCAEAGAGELVLLAPVGGEGEGRVCRVGVGQAHFLIRGFYSAI
jgi:hypothetical protein